MDMLSKIHDSQLLLPPVIPLIQSKNLVTLTNTPGEFLVVQGPPPQETMPIRVLELPSRTINGPPVKEVVMIYTPN